MGDKTKKKDVFVSVTAAIEDVDDAIKKFCVDTITLLKKQYTNYELVIVANGVADTPLENLTSLLKTHPCIRIIRLARNYNKETATFAGLEALIGDYNVVISPKNDPASVIPKMVDKLVDNNDIVLGISRTPLPHTLLNRLGRRWFFWYSGHFLEIDIPANATHLMGLNRRAINALTQVKGHHRHVRHISAQVGFRTATLTYEPIYAKDILSERGLLSSMSLALEIAVSYSRHPLRLMSKLSLLISGANLLIALYTVVVYFFKGNVVEGWTTLSLEISIMFFFAFAVLAVIAEYIGQMREELRGQPSYHIMEELTSNVLIADSTRRNVTK